MNYKELMLYWFNIKDRYKDHVIKCKAKNIKPMPYEQFKHIVKMERVNNY